MAQIAQIKVTQVGGPNATWMYKVWVYETGKTFFFMLPQRGVAFHTPEAAFQAAQTEGANFYKPAAPPFDWESNLKALKARLLTEE